MIKKYQTTLLSCICMLMISSSCMAMSIGAVAGHIILSLKHISAFMVATSYLMGLGLGIAAIFKFKQHKDNPTQVTIGTPLVMLVLSAGLVFLPGIYHPLGPPLFGSSNTDKYAGGVERNMHRTMPAYVLDRS